jgi:hypothetical protein
MSRVATMTAAMKNPTPDKAAKMGLTWALWVLVRRGTVAGATGR